MPVKDLISPVSKTQQFKICRTGRTSKHDKVVTVVGVETVRDSPTTPLNKRNYSDASLSCSFGALKGIYE